MKAKIFCLSLALENPHQVLDAYMSFATATVRKISLSLSDVTLYHQRYKLKVDGKPARNTSTWMQTHRDEHTYTLHPVT